MLNDYQKINNQYYDYIGDDTNTLYISGTIKYMETNNMNRYSFTIINNSKNHCAYCSREKYITIKVNRKFNFYICKNCVKKHADDQRDQTTMQRNWTPLYFVSNGEARFSFSLPESLYNKLMETSVNLEDN